MLGCRGDRQIHRKLGDSMACSCEWCGQQLESSDVVKRLDWARTINICKKCQQAKDEHRCIRCGSIKYNDILTNGLCEECSYELLVYREKELNDSIAQLSDDIDWQLDDREKVWRSKLFSTSKIQMSDTELSLQGTKEKQILDILLKEQEAVDFQCRQGFAMRKYGIQSETYDDMLLYANELQSLLERYSKKLLIPDKVNRVMYTIVFLDKAMYTMQVSERTSLLGDGDHFFLLPLKQEQIELNRFKQNIIKKSLQRYINQFNSKNS